MRESAIDLAVRQASDLRVPEEHGVSPMGAIDEGLGVVGIVDWTPLSVRATKQGGKKGARGRRDAAGGERGRACTE